MCKIGEDFYVEALACVPIKQCTNTEDSLSIYHMKIRVVTKVALDCSCDMNLEWEIRSLLSVQPLTRANLHVNFWAVSSGTPAASAGSNF